MATVHQCSLGEIAETLPRITECAVKKEFAEKGDDLFICACGFEERCLTIPRKLAEVSYRAGSSIYIRYATNSDENDSNLPALLTYLETISRQPVRSLDIDTHSFGDQLELMLKACQGAHGGKEATVAVDISVFANRLSMRCFKTLFEADIRLRVLYSEAAVYHPTKEEYTQDPQAWGRQDRLSLERGANDPSISPDHPGNHLDALPNTVILLPGYNPERSRAVIGKVDQSLLTAPDDKVVWFIGKPHLEEDAWREQAMRDINNISSEQPQYVVSTFDYRETLQFLDSLYARKWQNSNLTVSPNGSKMQALGASLFCYLHPDVRVYFATPKEYNTTKYTEGCKGQWMVDFGSMRQLRASLDSVGQLYVSD